MKKLSVLLGLLCLISVFTLTVKVNAAKPTTTDTNGVETGWERSDCATIESGTITDSLGNPVTVGYDQYGYNYQAHMFNGYYDNYSRPAVPATSGDKLIMKWSDPWLANVDCNLDGKLDRGLVDGTPGGISKGWLTNHLVGSYPDTEGNPQQYTDFVKIVWTGLGSPLWGQYTVIEEVWNDPAGGYHGLYSKLGAPGFGLNDQWTTSLTP
jgi:hypothetical protein